MAVIAINSYILHLILRFLILNSYQSSSGELNTYHVNQKIQQHTGESVAISNLLGVIEDKSTCKKNVMISIHQASELGKCIFANLSFDDHTKADLQTTAMISAANQCMKDLNEYLFETWCPEELQMFKIKLRLHIIYSMTLMAENFSRRDHLQERLRRKRGLISEDEENCGTKLKESFECYRNELSILSNALKTHRANSLSAEARVLHQHEAACDLAQNISNKCDQILCSPVNLDTQKIGYNDYIRTILPDFDIQSCRNF